MKVLAFAATNSRQSINQQLVRYATSQLEGAEIELIDLNDYEMPIYSIDRENDGGIPEAAHQFFKKIGEADAILISYAEHNGSYTAAYKNLYDWTSRIDMRVYQGKPVVLFATSPGPGGAQSVLAAAKASAPYFGAEVKAAVSVPKFFDNFDGESGQPTSDAVAAQVREAVAQLALEPAG